MTTPPATAARRPTARICFEAVPLTRFRRLAAAPPVGARVEPAEPGLSHQRSAESVRPHRFPARTLVTPGESARSDSTPSAPAARSLPASARLRFAGGHPARPVCSCLEPARSVRPRNLAAALPARPDRTPTAPAARVLPESARLRLAAAGPATRVCSCRETAGSVRLWNVAAAPPARLDRAPTAPAARFLPESARLRFAAVGPATRVCSCREIAGSVRLRNLAVALPARPDRTPTAPAVRFLPESARPRFTAAGHPTTTPPTPSLDTREAA